MCLHLASDAVLFVKSCQDSVCRSHLSVEASLGITVGFDMLLAAVSIAFMARRFSTDIVRWGAQKLQPGREKVKQLRAGQVDYPKAPANAHRVWRSTSVQPAQETRTLPIAASLPSAEKSEV